MAMSEGSLVLDIPLRKSDILWIRRLVFNLVWTPIAFVLIWLAVSTLWLFFLVSLPGLVSLSIGLVLSGSAQVYHELGWLSRLPAEIPSREKMGLIPRWLPIAVTAIAVIVSGFIIRLGIEWFRLFFPTGLWIVFNLTAAFATFSLGALIVGFWPLLLIQLYWEHREGKVIVKQGNYWVGKGA
jgi:hypothetical protein